jgi:hypothetical protein
MPLGSGGGYVFLLAKLEDNSDRQANSRIFGKATFFHPVGNQVATDRVVLQHDRLDNTPRSE